MPRSHRQEIRVFGPGERGGNKWCRVLVYVGNERRERTLTGITDTEEAHDVAQEYLAAVTVADEQAAAGADRHPRTFRELAERYKTQRRLSRHEARYVDKLVNVRLRSLQQRPLGNVLIENLCPELAQEAAIALYGQRTGKTMNRAAIAPFSAAVHYAADNRWLPPMRIPRFKQVERLTQRPGLGHPEQILAAAAVSKPKKCDRYKADHSYRYILLLFLFRQGWRIGETLRLNWSNVDLHARRFRDFKVDKGSAHKTIVMHPDVFEALSNLPECEPERARRGRHGRVFPRVGRHNVYRWLKPWLKRLGIHFSPHMARVEFASQLSEAGQNDTKIKDVCTWTDARAIHRYTRTSESECEATIALVGRRRS